LPPTTNKNTRDREVYRQQQSPFQPLQSSVSIADELSKLANLKQQGILSEDEFHLQMKQDLIKKNHGCSDAKAGGHPYINSPSKGSAFHTANFMQGYNDGYRICSHSSNTGPSGPIQRAIPKPAQGIITKTFNLNRDGIIFPIHYAISSNN
jgi:hypothetical protein